MQSCTKSQHMYVKVVNIHYGIFSFTHSRSSLNPLFRHAHKTFSTIQSKTHSKHLFLVLVIVVSALAARALHSRPRKLGTSSRTGSRQQVSAQQIRLGGGIVTGLTLGNVGAVDHVEPVAQAVAGLCNLQLDGANHGVVVSRVEIALLQGSGAVGHDDGADVGVGVAGPAGGRGDDIVDVVAGDPAGGQ